eukprot:scaffold42165_cov155-Skeletonema_dohrnii-CCMP3373.AAC.2
MSNNTSPMKKRKANDGRATADGTHDVNTSNTNDGGGFLSSWFGIFLGVVMMHQQDRQVMNN